MLKKISNSCDYSAYGSDHPFRQAGNIIVMVPFHGGS